MKKTPKFLLSRELGSHDNIFLALERSINSKAAHAKHKSDPVKRWCNSHASSLKKKSSRQEENGRNPITAAELETLWGTQESQCALTGDPITPETAEADHIVPVARGGTHTIDNIQIVTRQANVAKNTMTNREFIGLCRKVVRVHGLEDEYVLRFDEFDDI